MYIYFVVFLTILIICFPFDYDEIIVNFLLAQQGRMARIKAYRSIA